MTPNRDVSARFGPLTVVLFVSIILGGWQSHAMSQTPQVEQQRLETQALMVRTRQGKQFFFTVELADDPEEQRIGLMNRAELDPDAGMIFVHDEPRILGMWMKNTLIALDMLFIDAGGRILNIHENAIPGDLTSIRSRGRASAVLEIAGGRAAQLELSVGDQLFHCHFDNFPCKITAPQSDSGS
ncbi:MAG: DUF192 domain-containing protein [Pseudomonadota bacterium]